jgi:predicted DNA-binding helix-hairpin-helix protein
MSLPGEITVRQGNLGSSTPVKESSAQPSVVIVERLCYTGHTLYPLRHCGFDIEALPFDSNGRVPLDRDPKRAYAELHPTAAPIELNRASARELRRVPGIGPRSSRKILSARRTHRLRDTGQLRSLGILAERAAP